MGRTEGPQVRDPSDLDRLYSGRELKKLLMFYLESISDPVLDERLMHQLAVLAWEATRCVSRNARNNSGTSPRFGTNNKRLHWIVDNVAVLRGDGWPLGKTFDDVANETTNALRVRGRGRPPNEELQALRAYNIFAEGSRVIHRPDSREGFRNKKLHALIRASKDIRSIPD